VTEGKTKIHIRSKRGTSIRVPRSWTDADGEVQADLLRGSGVFTIDSLLRLIELVEAFRQRR
jgi:hypothetical protein